MKTKYTVIALFTLLNFIAACSNDKTSHSDTARSEWAFEKVDGQDIKFKSGRSFQTGLYELEYIGQIANGAKAPYLIFSGRYCKACDANISIYVHSPASGHIEIAGGRDRYDYPGIQTDFETGEPIHRSQAFYGQLSKGTTGVVWYQEDLAADGTWQKTTFTVNVSHATLYNKGLPITITDDGHPKYAQVLAYVKKGSCHEIKGGTIQVSHSKIGKITSPLSL